MSHTVFIVEDEAEIASVVELYLKAAGLNTQIFADGSQVVAAVKAQSPSLLLLDLMLPVKDGVTICQEVRSFSNVPIIMATAKVEEVDRLLGLELGADDYICKPYSAKEVVARVKAILRRLDNNFGIEQAKLEVSAEQHQLRYQSKQIELTAVEFRLFHLLYSHPNRIFSRQQILDNVYSDYREVTDRVVDSHIRNLRKKLKDLHDDHDWVRSVYGAGYKYEAI